MAKTVICSRVTLGNFPDVAAGCKSGQRRAILSTLAPRVAEGVESLAADYHAVTAGMSLAKGGDPMCSCDRFGGLHA